MENRLEKGEISTEPEKKETSLPKTKTVYINYSDVIDDGRVKGIMALCTQLISQQKPDSLYFLFSSNGGSVNAGVALYNFLKALPCKIIMHNTGSIDSIAAVIFLAGEERYAAPHSTFLYHGVKITINQGTNIDYHQTLELASRLRHDQDKIAGIIAENTSITKEEMKELFRQGESKDLDFAKEKGVITEIKPPTIPKEAPLISVDFK